MDKSQAVATLGEQTGSLGSLLQPTRLRAALHANDRLKLYLTVLQSAASHARAPQLPLMDLAREIRAADITARADAEWLADLPATATLQGQTLRIPELPRLAARIRGDLGGMARPFVDDRQPVGADPSLAALCQRVKGWQDRLAALQGPTLGADTLDALTHGRREHGDSLHLTVMDLHKALNRLAGTLASQTIAGAHVWQLADDGSDAARIEAFMRGIERTRALKLEHPGLDTAATRDGRLLLIQNDIGSNDAHVLVLQVDTAAQPMVTTLTYSDLHRQRFAFFQRQLQALGAQWSDTSARRDAALNQGMDYVVGTATFQAAGEAALATQLQGIGERIVFLIDWNRARKRLLPFTDRAGAVAVLEAAAQRRVGHRAWLAAGGERLLWNAMAAQGSGSFRLGDRLDQVLGAESAQAWLVDVLALAWRVHGQGQPAALVADEARASLARRMQGRRRELELLEEHAALIHALAQALRDALAHGHERDPAAAGEMAARAKAWERQADHLVMQARSEAERRPHWLPLQRLLERSDDVADALEEACFLFALLAEHFGAAHTARPRPAAAHTTQPCPGAGGLAEPVRLALGALAEAVLQAAQDHVKAIAVARSFDETSDAADHDEFLAACWRVLQAERQCDGLLRSARRALNQAARDDADAVALKLGTDLAVALEAASDALLALGHGLRERVLRRLEGSSA